MVLILYDPKLHYQSRDAIIDGIPDQVICGDALETMQGFKQTLVNQLG